jgi:hypothetical protein
MSKFFTIDVAGQHDVIYAYRGNDQHNTLGAPVPAADQAVARVQLSANMGEDQLDDVLTQMFVPVALRNRGRRLLIHLADDGLVMAWLLAIPA